VVAKAKLISKAKMPVDWEWGLEPHSRKDPLAPQVSSWGLRNNFSRMLDFIISNSSILSCAFRTSAVGDARSRLSSQQTAPRRTRRIQILSRTPHSRDGRHP
jgi:hypothetical protein